MLNWRDCYAVRKRPLPLSTRVVRESPPSSERQIGRRRGELRRSQRRSGCGILEPNKTKKTLILNESFTVVNRP